MSVGQKVKVQQTLTITTSNTTIEDVTTNDCNSWWHDKHIVATTENCYDTTDDSADDTKY
jgi:hypothetical protein